MCDYSVRQHPAWAVEMTNNVPRTNDQAYLYNKFCLLILFQHMFKVKITLSIKGYTLARNIREEKKNSLIYVVK